MAPLSPRAVEIRISGPIAPADLAGLTTRVCDLLAACDAYELRCDVRDVPVDVVTVDALARLQLAARRTGVRVRLRNASGELTDLARLMGLADVLTY